MNFSERVRYLPKFRRSVAPEHHDNPWVFPKSSWCDPIPEDPHIEESSTESPLLTLLKNFCATRDLPCPEHLFSLLEQKGVTLDALRRLVYSASDIQQFVDLDPDSCRGLVIFALGL